ncbi:MAG: hypothetical protein IJS78_01435 [Clostridia bacterium]|nr:hypothetical protein [Clostridia bacterium]
MDKNVTGECAVVENIKIPAASPRRADADGEARRRAEAEVKRILGRKPERVAIRRKSVDARRKGEIKLVYSVFAEFSELSEGEREKLASAGIKNYRETPFDPTPGAKKPGAPFVIAGFGPAGMFCALELAERGYRPVVFERGSSVEERVRKVGAFLSGGPFDPECNVQFGAGGAGTFSDGKLMTRIGDPTVSYILKRLCEFGAPEDVRWRARPHVGTDLLRGIVSNIEKRIVSLGGKVIYDTAVSFKNGRFYAGGAERDFSAMVLAVGHSARDTYGELMKGPFSVVPKPFSAGVRIEHPQEWLDRAMYGDLAGDETLGHAEYSLSYREGSRGTYSFCMCPGGVVVAASGEEGGVTTNGMSDRRRDGPLCNAAIAVSVLPDDYGGTPAGAIEFQRRLERDAYRAGGGNYHAPVQLVGDFFDRVPSKRLGSVVPTYMGGRVTPTDVRGILPPFIGDMLERGLRRFDDRIPGFAGRDIPLTGTETRTSAPVRIERTAALTAVGMERVYPCGEGAGYAGGIVSAAADGLRVASAIITEYSPF